MINAVLSPKTCRHCGTTFHPQRMMQAVCGPVCAGRKVRADKKAKEIAERALTRARRESLKTIHDRIREAQTEFNGYIRLRDAAKPCICCNQPLGVDAVGGGFDCGHYRSTGSASHLRFDERNAHGQRKHCNRYGAGRAVDYRLGLIGRIGVDAVESLEADNGVHKWEHAELIAIKLVYRAKRRAMEATA